MKRRSKTSIERRQQICQCVQHRQAGAACATTSINALPPEYVATHLQWHIEQENIDTRDGGNCAHLATRLGQRCKTLERDGTELPGDTTKILLSSMPTPRKNICVR
ncbi:hypothetical protein ACLK2D_12645 [Escherichia coli]